MIEAMTADNILWFSSGMLFVGLGYFVASVYRTRKLKHRIRLTKSRIRWM